MTDSARRDRWAALLAAVLALVSLGRCLAGDWLFDDYRFIVNNAALSDLGALDAFTDPGTADPTNVPDIYRPLRTLSFAVERELLGFGTIGFHAVSLLLHSLNAALVVLLARALGLRLPSAALAGMVFAVHPAQVEAVAWISARADPQSTAFALLALLSWLRSRGPDRWYALAVVGCVLAILSKEAAAVVPGLFVLVDLARRDGDGWKTVRRSWSRYLVPLVVSLLAFFLVKTMLEEARQLPMGHLQDRWWGGSFAVNLGVAFRAGMFQALFAAVPVRPSVDWYLPLAKDVWTLGVILPALFHVVLLGLALRFTFSVNEDRRLAGAGVLAAYVGGLATSHLLFPVGIPTADRFLYLPLLGGTLALAGLTHGLLLRLPRARTVAAVGVVALMIVSAMRAGVWASEASLWQHGPSGVYSPRNERHKLVVENEAAAELLAHAAHLQRSEEGEEAKRILGDVVTRLESAMPRAVALNAFWMKQLGLPFQASLEARLRRNLSAAYLRQGDADAALREARASLALDGDHALGHHAMAVALHRRGRYPAAGWAMEAAIRGDDAGVPAEDAAAILNEAARWRMQRGLFSAARRALAVSARLVPDETRNGARRSLADLEAQVRTQSEGIDAVPPNRRDAAWAVRRITFVGLAEQGVDGARVEFDRMVRKAPDSTALRTLWALATMEADDTEAGWRAAEAYHRATLDAAGGHPAVLVALARCQEALGHPDEARDLLRRVLSHPGTDEGLRTKAEVALKRLPLTFGRVIAARRSRGGVG